MGTFVQGLGHPWGRSLGQLIALFKVFKTRFGGGDTKIIHRPRLRSRGVGFKDNSGIPEPTSLIGVGRCFDLSFYMKNSEDDKDSMLVFILEKGMHWAIFDFDSSTYLKSALSMEGKSTATRYLIDFREELLIYRKDMIAELAT